MQTEPAAIWATEDRLLEPIARFSQFEGYRAFRSDLYPKYYAGNGLHLTDPLRIDLAEWEKVFESHFDESTFGHRYFIIRDPVAFETMREQGRLLGYDEVITTVGLAIDSTRSLVTVRDGLELEKIEGEEAWRDLFEFEDLSSKDESWYSREVSESLFEKTRHVSQEIGIEWFCIRDPISNKIASKAGVFMHKGNARLQNVATAPTHLRQGLASMVVSSITRYALDTRGAKQVCICADQDYLALTLYRKLGARDIAVQLGLMKYESHLRQDAR